MKRAFRVGYRSPVGSPLTPRERLVLACLARGLSNKQAAYELGVTINTIESQRISIMDRSGCTGPIQLGVWAVKHGFVSLEEEPNPPEKSAHGLIPQRSDPALGGAAGGAA